MPKASNSLFHHNPTIYSDGLTATERQQIEQRYAPYCRFQEFWIGFVDYQQGRDCPRGCPTASLARAGIVAQR
jgi:hypothetical protein